MSSDDGRGTLRRNLVTRKTLARLVELATQDGGAEPTAELEKPKKKKSRAKAAAPVAEAPAATETEDQPVE